MNSSRVVGLTVLLTVAAAFAPTAAYPLESSDDISQTDYLSALNHISPAAKEGAEMYMAAYQQRCGRGLSTRELRQSVSEGSGDPVLMGMIRAAGSRDQQQLKDLATRIQCAGSR